MKRFSRFIAVTAAVGILGLVCSAPAMAAGKSKGKATPAAKVNLNSATAQQLATLPGVGPKVAERIVEYRQQSGGFHSVEELMNVRGVGEKNLVKLQPYVVLDGARAEGSRAPAPKAVTAH